VPVEGPITPQASAGAAQPPPLPAVDATAPADAARPASVIEPASATLTSNERPTRLGPRNFTAATAEALDHALSETTAAVGCPKCQSTGYVVRAGAAGQANTGANDAQRRVTCEACGGKRVARLSAESYARLCQLAQTVTFVDAGQAEAETLAALSERAQLLLVSIGSDAKSVDALGRLAGFRLDQPQRKQSGIALAGTVQHVSQEGDLHLTRLVLFGLPKVVTVASWRPAPAGLREHDRVMILGVIVDDPARELMGYRGQLPQVVWGGLPVRLPSAP
jgi:hypothetical protein